MFNIFIFYLTYGLLWGLLALDISLKGWYSTPDWKRIIGCWVVNTILWPLGVWWILHEVFAKNPLALENKTFGWWRVTHGGDK
jgi:hypothetical protein